MRYAVASLLFLLAAGGASAIAHRQPTLLCDLVIVGLVVFAFLSLCAFMEDRLGR